MEEEEEEIYSGYREQRDNTIENDVKNNNYEDVRSVEIQNKNIAVTELIKSQFESKNVKTQRHVKMEVEDDREIELKRELQKCRTAIEIERNANLVRDNNFFYYIFILGLLCFYFVLFLFSFYYVNFSYVALYFCFSYIHLFLFS